MLRWLFLDMNSYFASVEQQVQRDLRGRPVAVVPLLSDTTCCIAASYEAKAYGIKTGTPVAQARQRCPHLRLVPANVSLYREFHARIVAIVETCLPEPQVLSVDEMACRLWRNEAHTADAMALGEHIKNEIKARLGMHLNCSVGLAPNSFLAKVAAEMQKPNGLVVIDEEDIPGKLLSLSLTDWPGISTRIAARLAQAGVFTTEQMYRLTEAQLRAIWGGINGERWWYLLRGHQVHLPPVRRGQVGHSFVLPPYLRTPDGAALIAGRLLEKAAERMRFLGYHARKLAVRVQSYKEAGWQSKVRFAPARDTWTLLEVLRHLWQDAVRHPCQVSVALYDVVSDMDVTGSLFGECDSLLLDGTSKKLQQATAVVDVLNRRYGRGTIGMASVLPVKNLAPDKIAFGRMLELD